MMPHAFPQVALGERIDAKELRESWFSYKISEILVVCRFY
jgi:hypothetical protein